MNHITNGAMPGVVTSAGAPGAYDTDVPTTDTTTRLNFATYGTSMKASMQPPVPTHAFDKAAIRASLTLLIDLLNVYSVQPLSTTKSANGRYSEIITNIKELKNQPALAKLLLVLMANQQKYMSTFALKENGIWSTAGGIARLKQRGVMIETIYQSIVDGTGRARHRIACYKLVGGVAL